MSGRQGTVAVMDIASGAIIGAFRLDVAARRLTKPGSAVKPFVLEILELAGRAAPAPCHPNTRIGSHNLACSHPTLPGPATPAEALAYSCNSWFAQMASRLTSHELADGLRRAGLATLTGLAPGEVSGSVGLTARLDDRRLQALGESHVLVTPLGLLAAYRKLARRAPPDVLEGMIGSAAFGTGRLAAPPNLTVAGKTGTATSGEGRYTHAWFAGVAPARTPQIAIVVFIEKGQGGKDAAPIAGKVFDAWLIQHAQLHRTPSAPLSIFRNTARVPIEGR